MSEIKITIDVPQLGGLITALEHIADSMCNTATATVTTAETQAVEDNTNKTKAVKMSAQNEESTDNKQYTLEEVRAVFMKCAKKHGKEEVKKILADLGVAKVTEIKEEDFAKAVKAVEEVK